MTLAFLTKMSTYGAVRTGDILYPVDNPLKRLSYSRFLLGVLNRLRRIIFRANEGLARSSWLTGAYNR